MKKQLFNLFILSLIVMMGGMSASCSKEVMLDTDGDTGAGGTLTVSTRAETGSGGDGMVSYPVAVYVFDVSDNCIATAVIEDKDAELSVKLTAGMYNVCAVAGAGSDDYVLPALANARRQSVIALRDGKSHSNLMYAENTVIIEPGETNNLNMVMARKVMLLQEVVINSVPEDITGVSVTVAPLYESLCLDGKYSGTNGSQTVVLTQDGGTDVWRNADGIYMLAASGNATVTVRMAGADGTKSYSYSFGGGLEANYKIRIEGTYVSNEGVLLAGTLTGTEWAGERTISFNFNEDGASGTGNVSGGTTPGGGGGGTVEGEAPAVGTMYKGCYVVSSKSLADGGNEVLLMSGNHKYGFDFDATDQTSVADAVNMEVESLAVDGIDGWRLPALVEIKNVMSDYAAINVVLKAAGAPTLVEGISFFYEETDGTISSYCKLGGPELNNKTRLRAFATVTFR